MQNTEVRSRRERKSRVFFDDIAEEKETLQRREKIAISIAKKASLQESKKSTKQKQKKQQQQEPKSQTKEETPKTQEKKPKKKENIPQKPEIAVKSTSRPQKPPKKLSISSDCLTITNYSEVSLEEEENKQMKSIRTELDEYKDEEDKEKLERIKNYSKKWKEGRKQRTLKTDLQKLFMQVSRIHSEMMDYFKSPSYKERLLIDDDFRKQQEGESLVLKYYRKKLADLSYSEQPKQQFQTIDYQSLSYKCMGCGYPFDRIWNYFHHYQKSPECQENVNEYMISFSQETCVFLKNRKSKKIKIFYNQGLVRKLEAIERFFFSSFPEEATDYIYDQQQQQEDDYMSNQIDSELNNEGGGCFGRGGLMDQQQQSIQKSCQTSTTLFRELSSATSPFIFPGSVQQINQFIVPETATPFIPLNVKQFKLYSEEKPTENNQVEFDQKPQNIQKNIEIHEKNEEKEAKKQEIKDTEQAAVAADIDNNGECDFEIVEDIEIVIGSEDEKQNQEEKQQNSSLSSGLQNSGKNCISEKEQKEQKIEIKKTHKQNLEEMQKKAFEQIEKVERLEKIEKVKVSQEQKIKRITVGQITKYLNQKILGKIRRKQLQKCQNWTQKNKSKQQQKQFWMHKHYSKIQFNMFQNINDQ